MATKRLVLLAIALLLGVLGAALFPVDCLVVKDRYNLFSAIFAIYPVLFVFSLVIVALLGSLYDVLTKFSWQRLVYRHEAYEHRILWQALLGLSYIVVLILALFLQVVPNDSVIYLLGGKLLVFLVIVSLLCSIPTPAVLYKHYMEKYDLMVQAKDPHRS